LWLEYSFRRQLSLKCPVCPVSNVSQRTGEKEFLVLDVQCLVSPPPKK
jgi:hypothetical protein